MAWGGGGWLPGGQSEKTRTVELNKEMGVYSMAGFVLWFNLFGFDYRGFRYAITLICSWGRGACRFIKKKKSNVIFVFAL